ncbi:MAG: hypothetical protein EXR70_24230, partial [Deltaproteobacteria bacterium]|nr:hypothetical protein [Deltaproteobacteria bacterium]
MTDRTCVAAIIVWPFIFLFPYTFNDIGSGNDFGQLYYVYKVYLLSMLNSGHFPLWSPTEGGGYPFFSSPFAQAFYPLNLFYFAYYKLLGRFAPWDYQILTIFGISIFGSGLFLWLRRLAVAAPVALVTVMISVISLKVTELLRLPNALHCAAWLPWLLYGATVATDLSKVKFGATVFGAALVMLLTAGYPYYIIYALLLIPAYVVAMALAPSRNLFIGESPESPSSFTCYAIHIGVAAGCAGILTFPWLRHMQTLMAQTVDRGTPDFQYATGHTFSPLKTLGSWIFPPVSNMEGWYYFGMATTLVIGFYIFSVSANFGVTSRERRLSIMLLAWLAFINYFSWGRDSALFTWTWHHLPVLNQMRVWGRMNIIQVPIIAMLLAMAIHHFLHAISSRQLIGSRKGIWVVAEVIVLTLAILRIQLYLIEQDLFDIYWTTYFKHADPGFGKSTSIHVTLKEFFDERFFVVTTVAIGAALVGFLLVARWAPPAKLGPIFLRSVLMLSVVEMFVISNYQWPSPRHLVKNQNFKSGNYNVPQLLVSEFSHPRSLASPMIMTSDMHGYNVGLTPSWGFKRHADPYLRYLNHNGEWQPGVTSNERTAVERFYGADQKAQRLFFSTRIDQKTVVDFMKDVDATEPLAKPTTQMDFYNGDELRLTVNLR